MAAFPEIRESVTRAMRRMLEVHVLLTLFGVVLLAVIWGATLSLIRLDRESSARVANESSLELLETYEAQITTNLAAIDQVLKTVKYAFELRGAQQALAELREKELLPPALLFTVSIAGSDGNIIASTRPGASEKIVDQSFIQQHRNPEHAGLRVGPATLDPATGEWQLRFSRRVEAEDGGVAGVVMISVAPEYFTSGYEHSRLGDQGVLGLVTADGRFLARRTGDHVSWDDTARHEPAPILNPGAVADSAQPSAWDGVRRYTHMRPVFGFPLAVMVGLSEAEQLAAYEHRKQHHLWEAAIASTALALLVIVVGRLTWQLANNRRRTHRDQETYYAATNASLDGFFILHSVCDAKGRVVDFVAVDTNKRGAKLFGTTREIAIGKTLCTVFPQVLANGVFEEFLAVAKSGVPAETEWENKLPGSGAKWLYRQVLRVENGVVVIVRDITERKQAELLRVEQARVLEMIAKDTPLEDVLASLMQLVESQFSGMMSSVLLVDKDGTHLRHGAALNLPADYVRAIDGMAIGPRVGSCGTAVHRREPVIVADILQDPLWDDFRALAIEHDLRSCWSMPIISQHDTVYGTFALYSRETHVPSEAEMELVGMVARIAGIAVERKQSEDRIRHMAHHDGLTGLPNRTLLEDRIEQALLYAQRYNRHVTVVFIDLDNFKLINDSLGHNAGDDLLKTVAQRMVACVRSTDTVVRLGGDEFVIVFVDQSPQLDAITPTLEKLLSAIGAPMAIGGQQLRVSASVGLATYPGDGTNPDMLLMNADAAMYRAKELGRNNYQFYTTEMNTRVHRKLEMQEGLRTALAREEFFVEYQPQVDMRSGKVFGVEVLLRWQHPQRGLVSPANFIPLAEECGLIVPIGEWVLRTACRQNKAWQDEGMAPVVVAVNVSARQFKDKTLISKVKQVLDETGLGPQYLELELTESLIMQDLQQAIATMQELQAMGVQLSIDDFGTGYSSLSALKSFPIARLKLDRSFVRDLPNQEDDSAIAMAVISLGHKLNLKVLAEGVETEEQLAFLRDNECDEMQGYFFSKPVSSDDVAILLRQQSHQPARPA